MCCGKYFVIGVGSQVRGGVTAIFVSSTRLVYRSCCRSAWFGASGKLGAKSESCDN